MLLEHSCFLLGVYYYEKNVLDDCCKIAVFDVCSGFMTVIFLISKLMTVVVNAYNIKTQSQQGLNDITVSYKPH